MNATATGSVMVLATSRSDRAVGQGFGAVADRRSSRGRSRSVGVLEATAGSCVVLAEATAVLAGAWAAQSIFWVPAAPGDRAPTVAELDASFRSPEAIDELNLADELGDAIVTEFTDIFDRFQRPVAPTAVQSPPARSPAIKTAGPATAIDAIAEIAPPEWMPAP